MDAPLIAALAQLGQKAGAITPSVYDTAECIRCIPAVNPQPSLSWLVQQQCADGGWGDPLEPQHRMIPTIAAMLALQTRDRAKYAHNIDLGLKLLHDVDPLWPQDLPRDLSVAAEIILPRLVAEAHAAQLNVPTHACNALQNFRARRLERLSQQTIHAGSPALHSWESWGSEPDESMLDATGSVGHSPSATAMWLHRTYSHQQLSKQRERAAHYIHEAATATGVDIAYVVPTVWPITRFEETFSLYALATLGLIQEPAIQHHIAPIVDDLHQRLLMFGGTGMSDAFDLDGDTTAAALAVVRACGRTCPSTHELFQRFRGYTAYPGELHGSVSVISRILHQFAIEGQDIESEIVPLCQHQLPDGRWQRDKWNVSWCYSAWHAVLPLSLAPPSALVDQALIMTVDALRRHQRVDGGWGPGITRLPDTTFAVLALLVIERTRFGAHIRPMIDAAHQWLAHHIDDPLPQTWIGKQLYSPVHVDRVLAHTALTASRARRVGE